jgi:protein TonB
MKYLFLAYCLLFALNGNAQTADTSKKVYTYVERMPAPPYSLPEYLAKNIHYPDAARENNIEGRVVVKFMVDKKGRISDAQVIRGIGGGCDEEALRVVEAMPNWKPGRNKGKRIKVWYNLPIIFKLQ